MRFLLVVTLLFLAACAPRVDTVQPLETQELVTSMPYQEAYGAVVNVVNTQPFPSDSGGWIITQSDQVGGFVAAQLSGCRKPIWGDCVDYVARVSIALVDRGGTTAVSISQNRHGEAVKLVDRIRERLGL